MLKSNPNLKVCVKIYIVELYTSLFQKTLKNWRKKSENILKNKHVNTFAPKDKFKRFIIGFYFQLKKKKEENNSYLLCLNARSNGIRRYLAG